MWHKELIRYAVVGALSFGIDLAIIAALVEWRGVDVLWASVVGYVVALLIDYRGAIGWVFPLRRMERERAIEIGVFALVGVLGLGVNTLVMATTSAAGIHYTLGKVVAGFAVMLFTFVVRRQLLFVSPPPARSAADG